MQELKKRGGIITGKSSPPHASPLHDIVKLVHLDAAHHPRPAIRLENHILEHLLVHVLFKNSRHALQMRQRNGPVGIISKQPKRLVELSIVGGRAAVLCVEFERANGEERLICGVSVLIGVEDRCEFGQFGR